MDESRNLILKESQKQINRLQLYNSFFQEDILYRIHMRTMVIHELFEKNTDLDINQLELFHLQFTASLLDLLNKIKKSNEENLQVLYNEIQINKDLLMNLTASLLTEKQYDLEKQNLSLKINISLKKIYEVLSDESSQYPYAKNLNLFSSKFSADFYTELNNENLPELINYKSEEVYSNAFVIIHKKLLGLLCKYEFRTSFFKGFKIGNLILEVYKFLDVDKYFLFFPTRNLFLFVDYNHLSTLYISGSNNTKENIIHELSDKVTLLESRLKITKTYISQDIKLLLMEDYKKISDIDFLKDMNNFNVQTNILKAMLNTDNL